MKLLDKIRGFLRPEEEPEASKAPEAPAPLKKACRQCGKTFTVDPAWGFVPTFCKDCRQKMAKEKEAAQRKGPLRDIRRTCKACGKFFSFPSDTLHYPSYCPDCRKRHQSAMKVLFLSQRYPPLSELLSGLPQASPVRHEGKIQP